MNLKFSSSHIKKVKINKLNKFILFNISKILPFQYVMNIKIPNEMVGEMES